MLLLLVLVCSLSLSAVGQQDNDEWLDPFDMLNYDASNKRMRKPAEQAKYDNVATKRREYIEHPGQAELTSCNKQLADLQREIESQKKTITHMSQQPSCNPVFKRFLSRLLKEIKRVGEPTDSGDVLYDAAIKMSKQAMSEIQTLLDGEDRWRAGALDSAISQILVNLKQHNYESWKWRFEDSFGVDVDTFLKIGLGILIIIASICTQLWSTVSWFVQFRRLFAVSFFTSVIWNWFYLYKIAFAEHQNNIVKMDSFNEKCTGVKKITWSDSLTAFYRSAFTLQDDPCKQYYEVLMVNPVLLVPPTKAISVTITTFITEPLKHFGQGISEFLRALLKDLPVTLQIPVLLTIVLAIVVCMYGSVQAAFQHGILAPFRRPRRDPPPPELERPPQPQPQPQPLPQPQPQPQPRPLRIEDWDPLAEGDALAPPPRQQQGPRQRAIDAGVHQQLRNQVHQKRPNRVRKEPVPVVVETLRTADPRYSEDETDAERREEGLEAEQNLSAASDSENQSDGLEELEGATAARVEDDTAQTKTSPSKSEPSKSKKKTLKETPKPSRDELIKDRDAEVRSQPPKEWLSHNSIQSLGAADRDGTAPVSLDSSATVPVQETRPSSAD